MGRAPCCDKANVKRGPWSPEEDTALKNYLQRHGTAGNWIALPHRAGLRRCGKSCRLRWLNYLRPDIKHGGFTEEEDNIICSLYKSIGSRWSVIASHLQGRTDNDIKNYWNTKLKKKLFAGKNTSTMKNNISSTQFTTSPLSPALLIKSDYGNNHGFSDHFNKNSTTLPLPMDHLNLERNRNSAGSSQSRDPIHHFPAEALEFGLSANNNTSNASSTPEMESSLSVQSSLENISWWPGNIDDSEYDRLLMDFGFGSSYDLLNEFGHDHDQRISTEAAPSVANSSTLYDNFMVNTSS